MCDKCQNKVTSSCGFDFASHGSHGLIVGYLGLLKYIFEDYFYISY